MLKFNIEKTFIWGSIIFLLTMIGIFSYRFIYFYNEQNKFEEEVKDIYEIIMADKVNASLYKIDNAYFYRGKEIDNYVIYSGILWRIIKLENNTLTLVSDLPLTNLYFNDGYEKSLINEYLNNDFYNLLDNHLIVDTETCISNNDDINNCLKTYSNKVVLPSISIYDKIGGTESFINNGYYTYLSNSNDGNYFIDNEGKINMISDNDTSNSLYGIKPVITINSTDIINGNGSKESPYLLDTPVSNLKDARVGSYVSFSGMTFRIVYNEENAKLILNDVINDVEIDGEFNTSSSLYKYLNTEFYSKLESDKIVEVEWNNGPYDGNLSTILDSKIVSKVGFANFNDLFINDVGMHTLLSVSSFNEFVYSVKDNGLIYRESIDENSLYQIRPMISIKNNVGITGLGTSDRPYIIGDVLNEENN